MCVCGYKWRGEGEGTCAEVPKEALCRALQDTMLRQPVHSSKQLHALAIAYSLVCYVNEYTTV